MQSENYSPLQKLVNETFQKLWFTPTPSHDQDAMNRKILNITDVVRTLCICVAGIVKMLCLPSDVTSPGFRCWHAKTRATTGLSSFSKM